MKRLLKIASLKLKKRYDIIVVQPFAHIGMVMTFVI